MSLSLSGIPWDLSQARIDKNFPLPLCAVNLLLSSAAFFPSLSLSPSASTPIIKDLGLSEAKGC